VALALLFTHPQLDYMLDYMLDHEQVATLARPISKVAPDWWDYTTLDSAVLKDAAKLTADNVERSALVVGDGASGL